MRVLVRFVQFGFGSIPISSRIEYYLGGIIALLLQDHRAVSTKSVCSSQYMVTDHHWATGLQVKHSTQYKSASVFSWFNCSSSSSRKQQVQYKLAVTLHHCLHHCAPWYLAEYCVLVSEVPSCQHLWSARCYQLSVPQVPCSTFGTCVFSVVGPTVWNSLCDPAVDSEQFRWDLKTCLFAGHSKR